MNNTPTPRTDAESISTGINFMPHAVSADFARTLERALTAALADYTRKINECNDVCAERDSLRAQLDILVWNAGKCEGIAKGILQPFEFAPEGMETPHSVLEAAKAVSEIARQRAQLQAQLEAVQCELDLCATENAHLGAERDALRQCVSDTSALENKTLALDAVQREAAALRAFVEAVASASVMHADWSAGDCIRSEYVDEAKELLASTTAGRNYVQRDVLERLYLAAKQCGEMDCDCGQQTCVERLQALTLAREELESTQ